MQGRKEGKWEGETGREEEQREKGAGGRQRRGKEGATTNLQMF